MPAIVISSSGMATGGRVLHHLRAALPESAEHRALRRLPGRRHARPQLVDGATVVKIHGADGPGRMPGSRGSTRCRRTRTRSEILRWLSGFTRPPRMTFLVHGEPPAMEALQAPIHQSLGWTTKSPATARRSRSTEAS